MNVLCPWGIANDGPVVCSWISFSDWLNFKLGTTLSVASKQLFHFCWAASSLIELTDFDTMLDLHTSPPQKKGNTKHKNRILAVMDYSSERARPILGHLAGTRLHSSGLLKHILCLFAVRSSLGCVLKYSMYIGDPHKRVEKLIIFHLRQL